MSERHNCETHCAAVKLIDFIETGVIAQWLLSDFDYQYPVYPTNTDGFSWGMIR